MPNYCVSPIVFIRFGKITLTILGIWSGNEIIAPHQPPSLSSSIRISNLPKNPWYADNLSHALWDVLWVVIMMRRKRSGGLLVLGHSDGPSLSSSGIVNIESYLTTNNAATWTGLLFAESLRSVVFSHASIVTVTFGRWRQATVWVDSEGNDWSCFPNEALSGREEGLVESLFSPWLHMIHPLLRSLTAYLIFIH